MNLIQERKLKCRKVTQEVKIRLSLIYRMIKMIQKSKVPSLFSISYSSYYLKGKINDFCLQKGTLNGEKSWEKKENAPRGNFSLLDSLVVRKPGRYSDEYDDAKKDCS